MNPNVRHNRIEVMLNPNETNCLDRLRGGLGRSPFLRHLIDTAARTDGKAPAPRKESRGCPGLGRQASRASQGMRRLI